MIWYETPVIVSTVMFLVLLLTTIFQAVIALEVGELLHEKYTLRYIRLLYNLLAVISGLLSLEALLAIASIEGGIFLKIPALPRYLLALPALFFLFTLKYPVKLPPLLRIPAINFFIPLLRLPLLDWLPWPLSLFFAVFAAAWFALDAARMLLAFRAYAHTEVTRDILAQIIRDIGSGICVANRRGWIIEANPAFYKLCENIGISKTERVDKFEAALKALKDDGRLTISEMENGKSIKTGKGVYFLQRSSFKAGKKIYFQLALSNVTEINSAASKLEQENEKLAQRNRALEKAITEIELEETELEREKLCRAVHDQWSQRLAVAGLSIDILLEQKYTWKNSGNLLEIARSLDIPMLFEPTQPSCDLAEVLPGLAGMYRKLGVELRIMGQANFTRCEKEVLCSVVREALANAVRHSYARQIDLFFYENSEISGISIRNKCLDDKPGVTEGRGLYDIRTRVNHAGGSIQFQKSDLFELKVTFPRDLKNLEEPVA